MDVEFARHVADYGIDQQDLIVTNATKHTCFCPTGGTEHNVTETLSGIHLSEHSDTSPQELKKEYALHELAGVFDLDSPNGKLHQYQFIISSDTSS